MNAVCPNLMKPSGSLAILLTCLKNHLNIKNKTMILFDDVHQSEKVKIFNKNVNVLENTRDVTFGEYQININTGGITIPSISPKEPLKEEISHFIDCIINNKTPITDGENGLAVVKVLALIQKSLDNNSVNIPI